MPTVENLHFAGSACAGVLQSEVKEEAAAGRRGT